MSKQVAVAIGLVGVVLTFTAWRVPVKGQERPSVTVICAPCDGEAFGIHADRGMVLMSPSGEMWFHVLRHAAPPIKIGTLRDVAAPMERTR